MYLYGASGHAKVIMDIIIAGGGRIDGLYDDNEKLTELMDYPIFHHEEIKGPLIVSIGLNKIRKMVVDKLHVDFGTAVHPSSILSPSVTIGEGTVVMPGAIINACSNIGKHCIINTGASIDHECEIGDFAHISPHSTLCGNVRVGEGTWIGAGTVVIPGVHIGKWCVIGAGTVVTKDIPDNVLAYGNNCKIIKELDSNNK